MSPFLEELAARRRFGMKPGLETIAALCERLGHPERRVPAVHVAGTNGKGAVVAMMDACLGAGSLRTLRYTSPHLVRLNERFVLRGKPADDATLEQAAARVAVAADEVGDVTFFEALTAVAFLLAAESGVDLSVLECGLGGRLDATNVCRSEISVITRIGLDHCAWLGETVAKIAGEKAGIIRPGVPVVLGRNEESVRAVIEDRARSLGAPFVYAPEIATASEIPTGFSLAGSFNRENAVTALAALKVLNRPFRPLGFERVVWPGRFQRIGDAIVDGAHNPPAARALACALAELNEEPRTLVAGFCADKDVDEVLRLLAPHVRSARAVRTNSPRSLSAEETALKMRAAGIDATAYPSLRAALGDCPRPLVCGSLFLAGEALVELGAYPGSVRFDPEEKLGCPKANVPCMP